MSHVVFCGCRCLSPGHRRVCFGLMFLHDIELTGKQMHVRMTGCPNGCARPYMAEVGLVGDGPNSYQLYLGGSSNQTRLAEVYMERMKMQV